MTDVTRGEFELLRQIVADNQRRLDTIDEHGTRGVGIVQVQLTEVIKDLSELKLDFVQEKNLRRANRKWVATFILVCIGTMGGIITVLIDLASKLHS